MRCGQGRREVAGIRPLIVGNSTDLGKKRPVYTGSRMHTRIPLRMPDDFDANLYIYNIPFFTTPIEASTAQRLLETGRFSGIKDSSGNVDYVAHLLPLRDDKTAVFVGNDVVFHSLKMAGADGVVSGVACALPELMLALDRAIAAGDDKKGEHLDAYLQEFVRHINRFPAPIGVKEAVKGRGLVAAGHSIPFGPQMRRQIDEFRAWFRNWYPAVIKDCK